MRRLPPRLLAAVAAVSATAVVTLTLFLVADEIAARSLAKADSAKVQELEALVGTDAETSVHLDEELERQTARSVARRDRNRRLGFVLAASAAVFLGAFKEWQKTRPAGALGAAKKVKGRDDARRPRRKGRAAPPPPDDTVDLADVDAIVERAGRGREATIPILQALQDRFRYLPEEALRRVVETTEITPAEIAGVASFYAQFRRTPVGRHVVRVCHGTACHVAGVGPIVDELKRRFDIPEGDDTDPERRFTLDPVACLGCCSLAPVLMVGDDVAGRLTPSSACEALLAVEEKLG